MFLERGIASFYYSAVAYLPPRSQSGWIFTASIAIPVNETCGVGGSSRGLLAKNPDTQSEVLNWRTERNLVLARGRIVEGCLLATGLRPIPAHHSNFAAVPFRLSLWDQNARKGKGRRLYGSDGSVRSFRPAKAQGMGGPIRLRPFRIIKYSEAVA